MEYNEGQPQRPRKQKFEPPPIVVVDTAKPESKDRTITNLYDAGRAAFVSALHGRGSEDANANFSTGTNWNSEAPSQEAAVTGSLASLILARDALAARTNMGMTITAKVDDTFYLFGEPKTEHVPITRLIDSPANNLTQSHKGKSR